MKYRQRNKPRGNKIFLIVSIFLIIIILIGLSSSKILPGKLNIVGKPVWILRDTIKNFFADSIRVLNSKSFLVLENKRLKNDLEKAEGQLLRINLLEKENEDLKNILGRENKFQSVLGRVLSKGSQSPYGTLIIDIEEGDVFKGQEVFSENLILIGKIEEVYGRTAKVRLLSAPGNKYDVEIGEESILGTAKGLGGGNFEIELPRGVDINVGDEIISPSLFIKLLGIVEHIDSAPQKSFQKILFKSPVNMDQIKWVLIKTNV